MINESLETMIKNVQTTPEIADSLRKRLSFLSPVSQSDFDFILKRINHENEAPKYIKIRNAKKECLKLIESIMLRGAAKKYVRKEAPDLNEAIVIVRTNCAKKGKYFLYEKSDLDYTIRQIRKYHK